MPLPVAAVERPEPPLMAPMAGAVAEPETISAALNVTPEESCDIEPLTLPLLWNVLLAVWKLWSSALMLEEPTPVNACALLRPPGEVTELPRPVVRPLVWLPEVLLAMPTSPVRCSKPAGPNVTFIGLAALPADTVLFVRFTACAALATFTVPAFSAV